MLQGPFCDMSTKELVALQQIFQNVFPEVYNKPEDIRSPTSVPFFDSWIIVYWLIVVSWSKLTLSPRLTLLHLVPSIGCFPLDSRYSLTPLIASLYPCLSNSCIVSTEKSNILLETVRSSFFRFTRIITSIWNRRASADDKWIRRIL